MITEVITLQDKVDGLATWLNLCSQVDYIHPTGDPAIDLEEYRENKTNYVVYSAISDLPLHEPESTEIHKMVEDVEEIDRKKEVSRLLSLQVMCLTEDDVADYARKIMEQFVMRADSEESLDKLEEVGLSLQDIGPVIDADLQKGDWIQRRSFIELEINYTSSITETMNVMEVIGLAVHADDTTIEMEIG